jgi:DNA-binding Xre family transcriptional regulator
MTKRKPGLREKRQRRFDHTGSTPDSLLEEDGVLAEVEATAIKRVIAWQLAQAMKTRGLSKTALAARMGTSRSQLDRLLDPSGGSVNLETVARAAQAVGKTLRIEIVDAD